MTSFLLVAVVIAGMVLVALLVTSVMADRDDPDRFSRAMNALGAQQGDPRAARRTAPAHRRPRPARRSARRPQARPRPSGRGRGAPADRA